jgi:predicted RNase H-like HicB family nuclease
VSSKDTLVLFRSEVEPWEGQYRASCPDFPRVEAFGDTPEEANHYLRRVILEIWTTLREYR